MSAEQDSLMRCKNQYGGWIAMKSEFLQTLVFCEIFLRQKVVLFLRYNTFLDAQAAVDVW